jgi:hypothetical protein
MPEEKPVEAPESMTLQLGQLVTWQGGVYRLIGVDPSGVHTHRAYLEDPATGEQRAVPLDGVSPADGAARHSACEPE